MKQLKLLFTVLFLAVLGLGNVWAVDPDYTLTPTAGSDNGYATAENITVGGITWNVTGNSTMTPWRLGGKSLSNVDRAVYSTTDYASAVSKIDLTVGAASSITVNSLKLVYSTNSDFSSSTEISGAFAANSTISFAPASGDFPANAYYKFVFNVSVSATSNKFLEFKKVEFYNATSGDPDPEEPTLESIVVSGTPTNTTYTAGDAFNPAGLVVTGTYSEGDPKTITEGITWSTPDALTAGQTSVEITATVAGVESEAYVVNGLTVTAPDPTVSFIFNTDAGLSALDIAKPASSNGTNLGDAAYTSGVIAMTATDGGSTATRVWNSSGTTSLRVYNNGGSLTFSGATITKIVFTGTVPMTANVGTFSEKTWTGSATSVTFTATSSVTISTIVVSYVAGSAAETVATPVLPAAGAFVGSKEIELTCATTDASIYYTLDGTNPTSASTLYNGAFTLTETATVKAIAVKDGMLNSSVASATYTKVVTLNSMDEIFAAATTAGSTAASKVITFDNWVISGVKGKNAYLTDNNGKGLIIFNKDANIDFEVGDILSGTATCNVQLYNGSAELTALTSTTDGLTVTKGGVATVQEIAVADLTGANTGAVIKFENVSYTQDGSKYYFGDLQAYWNLISAPASMVVGSKYDVTGVYVQYNAVKEIMPRSAADIEAATSDITLTSIAISGTVTKNAYYVGDEFNPAGLVVTATYSDASTLNVTSSVEWSIDPATLDNTSITTVNVTATFNEISSDPYPVGVIVAELPIWATTYTSNVTLTAQSDTKCNKEIVKVNDEETEYDALKMGTSSVAGSCTVTVPLGTTKLHYHAILWNGTSGSLVVKQAETELFNQAIAANTGLASSSPYTLAGNPTDDYYCIDFGSALTEATTLTFSCTNKRFAIYGVNVEKVDVELLSIAVSGTPTTTEYYDGQAFNPAGLVVTGTYNIGEPQEITEGINWAFDPATLATDVTSVTVTATVGDKVSAPFVVNGLTVSDPSSLGDAVIIVFPYNDFYYAMASDLTPVEVHMVNGKVVGVAEADRASLTWYKKEAEGMTTFQNMGGDYLIGGSNTTLSVGSTAYSWNWNATDKYYWKKDGPSERTFLYNNSGAIKNYASSNAGNSGYSTYPIFATEFVDGEKWTREFTSSNMGTHCYPFTIPAGAYTGATFYVPAYRIGDSKLYWDEVAADEDIVAGHPYLIVPDEEATELVAVKQDVDGAVAQTIGGFVGSFTQEFIAAFAGNYIVYQNQFRLAGDYVAVGANRAYIHLEDVTDHAVASAPGRRRISMNNADATVATGIEATIELNTEKVLINGAIFILRGEKMYNLNGQLVK